MPNLKFNDIVHLGLSVSNLDASIKWYEQVLALQLVNKMDLADRSVAFVVNSSTGLVIALAQHSQGIKGDFNEMRTGLDHIAFGVESKDDLDAWESHFSSLRVVHSPVSHMEIGSVLVFRDPDNIQLEMFWRNPS